MIQAPNIDEAIRIYYEKTTIDYKDIMIIFGCSSPTARKLRNQVSTKTRINTATAYNAWGFSIEDLELRQRRLLRLKSNTTNGGSTDDMPTGD